MVRVPLSPRQVVFVVALSAVACAFIYLVYREFQIKRPEEIYITTSGRVDMCLFCHTTEKLDPAHDARVIGCTPCHLGDPLAIDKGQAHTGIINNPGDLRVAAQTCGVEGCHPSDIKKVKNSLMATNRGILGTLLYYWGESVDHQDTDLTVEALIDSGQTSLAIDYYRKLCGTCHLWKQKNDLEGIAPFFNEKGGGCSACHYVIGCRVMNVRLSPTLKLRIPRRGKDYIHPLVTNNVPDVNCVRCHNRSGRIGLSYTGVFESEGYGTPYENGRLTTKKLPGNRFYLDLADDIHHRRGMSCIDCHTRDEIMGDGTSYAHYEEQLEISCVSCHSRQPGLTRKNNMLNNVDLLDGEYKLHGKVAETLWNLRPPKPGVCDFSGHRRVTCESCHSTWVPQCYGCHAKRDASLTHLDKLSLEQTPGRWEEGRSYIRYQQPMLAVWAEEIVIVTPGCQDIVTVVGKDGALETSFDRFTMAAINPHTTQKEGRSCADCHRSTRSVGLGEGNLFVEDGRVQFIPLDQGVETATGKTVGFDTFVALDGTPLQHGSRADLRPLNGDELRRILQIGSCVGCHDSYLDPAWKDYNEQTVCSRVGADDYFSGAVWPKTSAKQEKAEIQEE